jgi:uncharacterized membrane protein YeaQ/YmgE (transglycosylase-associated protein family)
VRCGALVGEGEDDTGMWMWNIFWWLVIGLIAGTLARKAVPGVRSGGLLVDLLTGLLGSLIGGVLTFFVPVLGWFFGIPAAFVGAVLLLFFLKRSASRMVR